MKLWVLQWLESTKTMSLDERGAHISILCNMWIGNEMPNDAEKLARLCSVPIDEMKAALPGVLGRYRIKNEILKNNRLEKERKEAKKEHNARVKGGKNSHKAKEIKELEQRLERKPSSSSAAPELAGQLQQSETESETESEVIQIPPNPLSGGTTSGEPAKAKTEAEPEYPPALNNPEFIAAWKEWVEYRREKRLSKLTPTGVRRQFKALAEWGVERAIAAIEYSIRQNYQGIHEEKTYGNFNRRNNRPTPESRGELAENLAL